MTSRLRALIDDWAEAMRAKDADRAMAHCAADVVTFDSAPLLVSSVNAKDSWRRGSPPGRARSAMRSAI